MSTQYFCSLYFDKSKSNFDGLIRSSLDTLGFLPTLMTIYVDADKMFEEILYDENFLFSVLGERPMSIKVFNQINEDSVKNLWFRIKDEDKFTSLTWSNSNLDFLISQNISQLLKIKGFTACYVYENNDAFDQTIEAKASGRSNATAYPGQAKYVCGMQFMAAPLMWFGEPFFRLISKNELLKFRKAQELNEGLIEVKLFDIYESPQKNENRKTQKEFWNFFGLDKVVEKFEEENGIDSVQALNDFLAKMKSPKEK